MVDNLNNRIIILYFFVLLHPHPEKKCIVARSHNRLFGDEAIKTRQCQNWLVNFRSYDFSLQEPELPNKIFKNH